MLVFPNSHWLKSRHFTSKLYTATPEINPLAPGYPLALTKSLAQSQEAPVPPTVLTALKFQVFAFKHKTSLDIHSLLFAHTGTLGSYKNCRSIDRQQDACLSHFKEQGN